ncbi:MAG: serine/threonine-protein kinase [Myxococcales bacterium]|nr:serine/threonine protein kinase [Myxococcota bacterium]MDW8282884.1 serine/threonine-protein kinase [Myxococcales bacterium]
MPMPPTAWMGQVLKETYRLDELVGEGGTGHVYRGFHLRLRIQVAVKILRHNAGEMAFARFRKEAEVTARLRHPGIVQVIDYDVTPEGRAYLVTEWLEGETLAAYLRRRGALPPAEAVALLSQVCDAVGAAHAAGVIHRDLKPANLFLLAGEGPPQVKVLDFGIAKLIESDPVRTEEGQTLGTPRYMSPEQIRIDGGGDVGPASDQWSLGVIAYEMVAGRPAFPGSAHAAMLAVLDNRPAPLPKTVPQGYRLAVARAMRTDPVERWPDVAALRRALEESVVEELPQEPLPRWLLLGGVGLSVVLLALVVWAHARSTTPTAVLSDLALPPSLPSQGEAVLRTLQPAVTPLDLGSPEPALQSVRVRVQPQGAQVFIGGRPLQGGVVQLPAGVPVRIRVLPPPRSCCQPRELSYTPPLGRPPPPLMIELRCDKNCPFY